MGTELKGEFSKDETQTFQNANQNYFKIHLTQVIIAKINKTNNSRCW